MSCCKGTLIERATASPISYKELGLVNTRAMFAHAYKHQYGVPAYNFNNMEQLQAITRACIESDSPFILQVSAGARKYADQTLLRFLAMGAVAVVRAAKSQVKFALHLDHGPSFEVAKACIDAGFSSVMIDGSHLSFEKNIEVTKKVVEYAHARDVTVEGELGVLAGVEDEVSHEHSSYTRPEEVEEFVKRTGVDSLAISIGTSHGATKFKPHQCTRNADGVLVPPPLRFDILSEVQKRIPGFPIVLHGASSVIPKYVKAYNEAGGKLADAVGIPEDQLRAATKLGVCKINVDSDGRLAFSSVVRQIFKAKPAEFDPRNYLGPAREELQKMIVRKNKIVYGSAGQASKIWPKQAKL